MFRAVHRLSGTKFNASPQPCRYEGAGKDAAEEGEQ